MPFSLPLPQQHTGLPFSHSNWPLVKALSKKRGKWQGRNLHRSLPHPQHGHVMEVLNCPTQVWVLPQVRGGERPRLHNSLVTRHPVLPFPITHPPPLMETGHQVERTEEGNVAQKEEGTLAVESSRICLARAGDGEKKEAAQHVRGLSCQMWPLPGVCLPLRLHT